MVGEPARAVHHLEQPILDCNQLRVLPKTVSYGIAYSCKSPHALPFFPGLDAQGPMEIKEVMTRSMVDALSELCFPFLGRQLRIHCSDSEWSFSTNQISVTRITSAQIEIKWDLIAKT